MADAPQDAAPESPKHPPTLAQLADTSSADERLRSHRLLVGSPGAYWERDLVSGEAWFSANFFAVTGMAPTTDRELVHARIHPDDRADFEAAYQVAVSTLGELVHDLRYRSADGSYRWARLQGKVWHDGQGRPARIVGMVTDIHEQTLEKQELLQHRQRLQQMVEERTARLEAALADAQRQHEQAEQANEAKSVFLAHMSHEIRTPLNGLLGLNELALREAGSSQQRRFLKLALQSGHGLLEMLNGVLDFSRLSAGVAPSRAEPFDLAEALANCLRQAMPLAREKNLGAMYDYQGQVTRLVCDVQRIQQVATNLLTNALKFTEQGHVAVLTRVSPVADGHCRVEIDVTDTGPGMDAEVAAKVFEPFVQGDDSLARQHGGSGLGLSIARSLCESMGGSLSLRTAPSQGATFTVRLQLPAEPGVSAEAVPLPQGHAWLVYNRPVPAQWLAGRLGRLGWQSEVITSLGEAVQRAARPDVPRPDLVALAEAACADPAALAALRRHLPDTAITLLARPDWNQPQVESAARANNLSLNFMPLTPAALQTLLLTKARPPAAAESAFAELEPGGLDGVEVLIAEDNPINQLIITEMVVALGLRTRLAEDGEKAVSACLDKPPQLLLMDLQMPVMDGLEATRRLTELQRKGRLAAFPIVALTAHATPQDHDRCMAAGMQGFLTKPISLGLLRAELRRWIAV